MKILSYLNLSNASNLEADSGYVFQRTILYELAKSGHEVILVGPPNMPNLPPTICSIEIEMSESKFGIRYGFAWKVLKQKLQDIAGSIDIILMNQSELSVPFSLMMSELTGKKVPIVTYFHYLAVRQFQDGKVIWDPSQNFMDVASFSWSRQINSALYSNACIIGSEFGKDLFLKCSGEFSQSLEGKFLIIPPPVKRLGEANLRTGNDPPIIFYNHRLYDNYGGKKVFELLAKVHKKVPFQVIITDPTAGRSQIRNKLDASINRTKEFIKTLDFAQIMHFQTQEEYYRAIENIDVGLAPLRIGALWSMSTADVMSAGRPVLAPDKEVFQDIINESDLLFSSEVDFCQKLERILKDNHLRIQKGFVLQQRSKNLLPANIAGRFEEVFIKVLQSQNRYVFN